MNSPTRPEQKLRTSLILAAMEGQEGFGLSLPEKSETERVGRYRGEVMMGSMMMGMMRMLIG